MKKSLFILALFLGTSVSLFSQTSTQCSGTTKKGVQCKNKTTATNGLCHLHGGNKVVETGSVAVAAQCTAIAKSTGVQCRNKTHFSNGLCHLHGGK